MQFRALFAGSGLRAARTGTGPHPRHCAPRSPRICIPVRSGTMVYDSARVFIFSPVAEMRKWASEGLPKILAQLVQAQVPSLPPCEPSPPPWTPSLRPLPPPGLFLPVSSSPALRSHSIPHPAPQFLPTPASAFLAGGTGHRQMGNPRTSSLPVPFRLLFWCPRLRGKDIGAEESPTSPGQEQSIQFHSWPVEFRLSASPRVTWNVTNPVNGPGWIARQ